MSPDQISVNEEFCFADLDQSNSSATWQQPGTHPEHGLSEEEPGKACTGCSPCTTSSVQASQVA